MQKPELRQRIALSPQVYQGLSMLAMPALELQALIEAEVLENPLLEIEEPEVDAPEPEASVDSTPTEEDRAWEDWLNSYDELYSIEISTPRDPDTESVSVENYIGSVQTFDDYLVAQLGMMMLDEDVRRAALAVIGLLDGDGYFSATLDEVVRIARVDFRCAESALFVVQQLDPPGVGGRNLIEVLLLQVAYLELVDPLLEPLITNHLDDIAAMRFRKLSRVFRVSEEDILRAVQVIRMLNPRPAGEFSAGETPGDVVPDVILRRFDDGWVVSANSESIPSLRISVRYRGLLRENSGADHETRRYLKDKIRSAENFIRNIDRRKSTIVRIAEVVVNVQRDFFEDGKGDLRPLKLEDVAIELGVHLSTVSRGVTGKYMMTPYGLFELRHFFSGGYRTKAGLDIASTTIKQSIKDIIADEDSAKPYSDQQLVGKLGKEGIVVARRTVAKYREELKIEPSWARRRK